MPSGTSGTKHPGSCYSSLRSPPSSDPCSSSAPGTQSAACSSKPKRKQPGHKAPIAPLTNRVARCAHNIAPKRKQPGHKARAVR